MNDYFKYVLILVLPIIFMLTGKNVKADNPITTDSLSHILKNAKNLIPHDLRTADSLASFVIEKQLPGRNDSLTGRAFYLLGVINYYKGNHLLSSGYYNKGLETELAQSDEKFASALWNNLGVNFEYENEYQKAVEAYLKSLQLAERLNDSLSIYQSYINIGLLYVWLADYTEAETYLNQALDYFIRVEDNNHIGLCCHNLAILYDRTEKSEKAVETYDQAIDFYRKAGNRMELASASHDKINYLLETGNYSTARSELENAAVSEEQLSNSYTSGNLKVLRGKYYFYAEKNYEKAEKHFWDAVTLLENSNAKKQQLNAYYMLTNLYAVTGNTKKHRQVLNKYDELLQQNYNEKSSGNIAELRTLYEVEQKNLQMQALRKQTAQQKQIILLSAILLLLVSGSIFIFYRFNRKLNKKHRALYARNMEMAKTIEREQVQQTKTVQQNNSVTEINNQFFFEEMFEQIKKHIIQTKRYLDPSLKVADIATELGTNEKYVSQAISIGSNTRYNEFIAVYRINEAKKLLSSSHNKSLSINDIALKSGFSNQSTFQRKFKEMTGMTPYTFKRIACEQMVYSLKEN